MSIQISGFTESDKVPGGVAQNVWSAGKISIGSIPLQCVLYGNKTSGGSAAINSKTRVTTSEEADAFWGSHSELARMAHAALDVSGTTIYGICVAEATGAAATLLIEFGGTWTTAGEVTLQLDEEIFRVSFGTSDSTAVAAANVSSAKINGLQDGRLFCTAAQSTLGASNTAVTQSGTGPVVTITGTPAASYDAVIKIDLAGARGTATFRWSLDGGVTWQATGVVTAATNALGSTGLTANFATGNYVLNETYSWTSLGAGSGYVTLTVANVGVRGNQHTGFIVDQSKRPSGMTVRLHGGAPLPNTGVPFSGGAGTDDLTAALAANSAVLNDYEAIAQNDATNVGLVETATFNKAAFDVGLLQQYVVSTNGTLTQAIALGQTQMNDVLGCCVWSQYGVEHPSRVTARIAALYSITDGGDANHNYDDTVVPGGAPNFLPSDSPNRATLNAALNAGVMPLKTEDDGLLIVRAINSHCLNGATPDFRTYDHAETTVPIRVRKELLAMYVQVKSQNPYSGPDFEDALPPEGTLTPRVWDSTVNAQLAVWELPPFNWLTETAANPSQSEWDSDAKRIMGVVPTLVKPQDHQLGVVVRQQSVS